MNEINTTGGTNIPVTGNQIQWNYTPANVNVCPTCGRCPTCGHPYKTYPQYVYPHPYYEYRPYWQNLIVY